MELMATCLDKLLKKTKRPIPEKILGKMAVAVSTSFLSWVFFEETTRYLYHHHAQSLTFCNISVVTIDTYFKLWQDFDNQKGDLNNKGN